MPLSGNTLSNLKQEIKTTFQSIVTIPPGADSETIKIINSNLEKLSEGLSIAIQNYILQADVDLSGVDYKIDQVPCSVNITTTIGVAQGNTSEIVTKPSGTGKLK